VLGEDRTVGAREGGKECTPEGLACFCEAVRWCSGIEARFCVDSALGRELTRNDYWFEGV